MQDRPLFWRRLALLLTLLLVPALCVAGAFASNLQITSPYFTLSFGPQRAGQPPVIVYNGGPNLPPVGGGGPSTGTPPGTGGPQQPGGPTATVTTSCLLGLVCLSVDAGLGTAQVLSVDLGKEGVATHNAGSGDCAGLVCVDAGLQNGDLSLNVDAVGSQLGVNGGTNDEQLEIELDLPGGDDDEGLNLNVLDLVQVGVGGGTGGVTIGLGLPSLFP